MTFNDSDDLELFSNIHYIGLYEAVIRKEGPPVQKLIFFTAWKPQEAHGHRPRSSAGFQAVKFISFCTEGTS